MNKNIIPMSGGKDSLATALVALERETENTEYVFADTGNEHPLTYEYLDYLEFTLGVAIRRVKADFTAAIKRKRHIVETKWREEGVSEEIIHRALFVLRPTGNPFLDICLQKGRFPSTRKRFCSEKLKHEPMYAQVIAPALADCVYGEVWVWQGVRAQESTERAKLADYEEDPARDGLVTYRPILKWAHEDVFAIAKRHGIKPNPLYRLGMGRVGCMPCIHAGKREVRQIAQRFPEEVKRIAEWEKLVSLAAKQGVSIMMDARDVQRYKGLPKLTAETSRLITTDSHGIQQYVEWAKSKRGGREGDEPEAVDAPLCSSIYGLCE